VLASVLAMHKPTAKAVVSAAGISVFPHVLADGGEPEQVADTCRRALGMPVMLKPCSQGGSIGMQVLRDTGALAAALAGSSGRGEWFVEPFTTGAAVTCGVLQLSELWRCHR
jgi:D-alanine-D-alanine ligase